MGTYSELKIIKATLIDLGIESDKIKESAKVHSDLGLDSSEIIEVVLALKNAFDFDVSLLYKISNDITLGEICQLVNSKGSAK